MNALDQLMQHARTTQLHICVDLASAPDGLKRVTGAHHPDGARSLFENALTTDADKVAPWLVPCPASKVSGWLSKSLMLARDTPSVTWIFSSRSTADLHEKLSRRLDIALSDGTDFMLRYFDPRVLSELDSVFESEERIKFFSFFERWCYLNRDAKLCEISESESEFAQLDPFVSPLRIGQKTEAALLLATEAGQVLVETLKRWPDELLRRTPESRFALAKESCLQATLANSDNLADKVLLLMHAADQADGFFNMPAWLAQSKKISTGELALSSLIDVSSTEI